MTPSRWLRCADALAFSSLWAGAVAVGLAGAASKAMGFAPDAAVGVLVFGGTVAVYGVDRLRDVARDRVTAPLRTGFVERHRPELAALAAAAAVAGLLAAGWLGKPGVWIACVVAGALGLAHRRLKQVPIFKGLYVTGAWLAVVVGTPALAAGSLPASPLVAWTAGILGAAILANVVASSLRDADAGAGRSPGLALGIARALPVLGIALGLAGPAEVRSLAWVPAALGVALLRRPDQERYALWVVDGSLLLGALLALF